MPLNGLFTYSPFYSGVLDTRLLSWQWKSKQFYTQRQQRWRARDKRSQSDLKRFLRTTRRAKLDKKRNWVTVYLALFCNLVAAQVPCTIIVRGYGHKQKMEIIKWMFSFFEWSWLSGRRWCWNIKQNIKIIYDVDRWASADRWHSQASTTPY